MIDETMRDGGGFNGRGKLRGQLYLHASRVPLREADLRTARELTAAAGQGALFDEDALGSDCDAGTCFT